MMDSDDNNKDLALLLGSFEKLKQQVQKTEEGRKRNAELQKDLDSERREVKKVLKEKAEVKSELFKLQETIKEQNECMKKKDDELAQIRGENARLQESERMLTKEIDKLRCEINSQIFKIDRFRKIIEGRDTVSEMTSLREQNQSLHDQNQALKARLALAEAYSSSDASVQDLRTQLQQSQVVIKGYSDREDVMVRNLAEQVDTVAALREELNTLKESVSKERADSKAEYKSLEQLYDTPVDGYHGALRQIASQEQSQSSRDLPLKLSSQRDKRSLVGEESGDCGGPSKNRRVYLEENQDADVLEIPSRNSQMAVPGTRALPIDLSNPKMTNTQAASRQGEAKANDCLEAHARGPLVNSKTPRLEPTPMEVIKATSSRQLDQLNAWYGQLRRLYEYHQQHRNFRPPRMGASNCLGSWAADQRSQLSGEYHSYLTPGKTDALKQIGFE